MSDDNELVRRVRQSLDASVQTLDPEIVRRLAQARTRALAARTGLRPAFAWGGGGLALAASLMLAVGVWQQPAPNAGDGFSEALDAIVMEDALDLYEDLDFYLWLAQQDARA